MHVEAEAFGRPARAISPAPTASTSPACLGASPARRDLPALLGGRRPRRCLGRAGAETARAERTGLPIRLALSPIHLQSASAPSLTPPLPYVPEPRGVADLARNRLLREVLRQTLNDQSGAFAKASDCRIPVRSSKHTVPGFLAAPDPGIARLFVRLSQLERTSSSRWARPRGRQLLRRKPCHSASARASRAAARRRS